MAEPRANPTSRPPATARGMAAHVLGRVIEEGAWSQKAIDSELRAFKGDPRDAALCTALVYGVLTWRLRIDAILDASLRSGLGSLPFKARHHLRVAVYQLGWMSERMPASAVVNEAVHLVRQECGQGLGAVANGVLRGILRRADQVFAPAGVPGSATELAQVVALPVWIAERLMAALPADRAVAVAEHWNKPSRVHFRVRTGDVDGAIAALQEAGISAEAHAQVPDAIVLSGGGVAAALAAMPGALAVQDAGSQLAALALPELPQARVLDACAGLGVKSVHLSDRLSGATLVCTDRNARKLAQMAAPQEGHARPMVGAWDIPEAAPGVVTENAPFDVVVIDAPCTGLGTLGRHPEVRQNRRADDVAALSTLQATILDAVAPLVAPGGWLLYMVCTWTPEEGQQQIDRFIGAHPEFAVQPPDAASADPRVDWSAWVDRSGSVTLWPDRVDADSFFLCRMRRRAEA